LLGAYFGAGLNSYNRARFFTMRQICRLVYAVLMLKLADASNSTGIIDDPDLQTVTLQQVGEQIGAGKLSLSGYRGQLLFGKALINAALADMRSPRFIDSMTLLAEVREK